MRYTRIYKIWSKMRERCYNPNDKEYPHYGARGIKILWKDFIEFKNDMYESYLKHVEEFGERQTTIDRINVNGNYCKENCRWATSREQNLNKRFPLGIIPQPDGTTISVSRYCELNNIPYSRLEKLARKYKKKPIELLYEMHIGKEQPDAELMERETTTLYVYKGVKYTYEDLLKALGIEEDSLFRQRMKAYKQDLFKVLKRWYTKEEVTILE